LINALQSDVKISLFHNKIHIIKCVAVILTIAWRPSNVDYYFGLLL